MCFLVLMVFLLIMMFFYIEFLSMLSVKEGEGV